MKYLDIKILVKQGLIACLLLTTTGVSFAEVCKADRIDEVVSVKTVYDGDTVLLNDGRKVRFIGINTPETGRKDRPAEAFSEAAKTFLLNLIDQQNNKIGLRFDQQKKDRYGRLLAHVFSADKTSIQAVLLEKGLAAVIIFPPNTFQLGCYQRAEFVARKEKLNLWSSDRFIETTELDVENFMPGFMFLTGQVSKLTHTKKSIWITMLGNLSLRIARKDLRIFTNLNLDKLRDKKITVRGWVYLYKGKPVIRIRHPSAINIL